MLTRSQQLYALLAVFIFVALLFWLWKAVVQQQKRKQRKLHYYLCDGIRWYLGGVDLDGPYCDKCVEPMRPWGQEGDAQACSKCGHRVPGHARHLKAKAQSLIERDRERMDRSNFRTVGKK